MTRAARNNRGGKRYGTAGKSYTNRTDLNQPIRTATGQPYGMAQQQRQEQQAIPLPTQAAPATASGGAAPPGATSPVPPGEGAPMVAPGSLGPLDAPTQRPNEPVTAGLSSGPGPGPEVLQPQGGLNPIDEVRAMYAANPSDDMRRLLAYLDGGG